MMCRRCRVELTPDTQTPGQAKFGNHVCRECNRAYQRMYFARHRDLMCRRARWHKAVIRDAVLDAYGGACVCCGETTREFLTLDHVHNDGARYRMAGPRSGDALYRTL